MAHRRILGDTNRVTQTDESGRFSFTGLPSGEYLLSAMDTGTAIVIPSPELSEKLEKVVTLVEGASATTELQLIITDSLWMDFSR
jgi:hypothetical protein